MRKMRDLYRRLDQIQHTLWFRITASVLALLFCVATFGVLLYTSSDLEAQRSALVRALTNQNIGEGDDHAVSLSESGTVTVDGRTYGGERFYEARRVLFNDRGTIVEPAALAEALISDEYPGWAPRWLLEQPRTTAVAGALTLGWLVLIIWLALTLPFVLTLLATGGAVALAWIFGWEQAMWALTGMGLLTFTFVLLSHAMQLLYRRPIQVLAVAHTVLKEASRTNIPLVFIILLLVALPLLPLGLDPDSPLRFRVQTFISRSLGLTFYAAACMTLFLSCATVAFEIRDRQIWHLVTKPLGRFTYLLGKWVGVISVNLIIMVIASISIFMFIQYLRQQPVSSGMEGAIDRQLVRDSVLTARIGTTPKYEELDENQLSERVEAFIRNAPDLAVMDEVPLDLRRHIREDIIQKFSLGQRTVPPRQNPGAPTSAHDYHFTGLSQAKELGSTLTLRYRFHILRDDEHRTYPVVFFFNHDGSTMVEREYIPTMTHVLPLPSDWIQEDGTLLVTVANPYVPLPDEQGYGSLNFELDDFELLYSVGSFEANFARAIFVDWVKLAFLAMLGICSATFLSFSVACLTSFTIFIAGTVGPFLATALQEWYPPSMQSMDWADLGMVIQWVFMSFIRLVAQAIVFLLEAFGEFRPTQALVQGRLIPWRVVWLSALKLGVLWSGITLLIGWLVMRGRQLAIYSGHG